MASFPATTEGVDEAATMVEAFIRKSEPDWSLPQSVRDALLDDVHALETGRDINYMRVHDASDGLLRPLAPEQRLRCAQPAW